MSTCSRWETAMSVNLTAIVLAAKYTIPHMRNAGGER